MNNRGPDSERRQSLCESCLGQGQTIRPRTILTVGQGVDHGFTGDAIGLLLVENRSDRHEKLDTETILWRLHLGQFHGCTPGAIRPVATGFVGNGEKRPPEILGAIVKRWRWGYHEMSESLAVIEGPTHCLTS